MVEPREEAPRDPGGAVQDGRLDSWKEIAVHFGRDVSTVRRWERSEGLPVHRHQHQKRGSVFAYRAELDVWWENGHARVESDEKSLGSRVWRLWIPASAALVLIAGLWFGLSDRQARSPQQEWKVRPLTSYPGGERFPSFSPAGSQVAFAYRKESRNDFDIYVKDARSPTLLPLTESPHSDVAPAWSPDGRLIAFFRRFKREGRSRSSSEAPLPPAAIFTISPLGGPERLLLELHAPFRPRSRPPFLQLSWSPDGKLLVFQDRHARRSPFSIYVLSIESGETRKLTSPPAKWRGDGTGAFSPDGNTVAFVRQNNRGQGDLYLTSMSGGEPRRLTFDESMLLGLAWKPNGREIVFSSLAGGALLLWQVSVSGGTPQRLPLSTGFDDFPAISASGTELAFGRRRRDKNIWRVQRGNGKEINPVSRLIVSTRIDNMPRFSPDGKRIAFFSNRSGRFQLWICNQDGSNPVQLTFVKPYAGGIPSWSPDGKHITFQAGDEENWDIYVISQQGGRPRRLTSHPAYERLASWSCDGSWIYFASDRTGSYQVWKIPQAGGSAVQVTREGGYRAVESPAADFVYYSKHRNIHGVWKVPVAGGKEVPVLEELESTWTVVGSGLGFYAARGVRGSEKKWSIEFFDLETGQRNTLQELSRRPNLLAPPAFSPDGSTILFVQ